MDELLLAVLSGDINKVTFLLKQGFLNPACENNNPLLFAYKKDYFDIFKVLLNDPRVNPAIKSNYFIINATKHNKANYAKILWNDKRVQDSLNTRLHDRLSKKILEINITSF